MNGEVCCILGICCPPEQRAAALAKEMTKDGLFFNNEHAQRVAEYIFKHFDLAAAGTLQPLVSHVAKIAKGG